MSRKHEEPKHDAVDQATGEPLPNTIPDGAKTVPYRMPSPNHTIEGRLLNFLYATERLLTNKDDAEASSTMLHLFPQVFFDHVKLRPNLPESLAAAIQAENKDGK